jgi:hypothetical protein
MIKFRPLTNDEAQSGTHFCGRCETWQRRFELHQCTPTKRWREAKAAMHAANPLPPPFTTKRVSQTPVDDVSNDDFGDPEGEVAAREE